MRNALKRGFLTAAFGAASAGLAVVAAPLAITSPLGFAAMAGFGVSITGFWSNLLNMLPLRMPKETGMPLSADEIELFKSVFGRKVADADLEKVKKYFEPRDTSALAAVFNRRVIKFYGAAQHEADYSAAKSPQNFGVFMHEMTHIWQRTSASVSMMRSIRRTRKYNYKLTKRSRFTFYGVEQQASIIEDYARRFLYPRGDVPAARMVITPENDALLQKVVERKFPAARAARLALADKKRAQATPEARKNFLRELSRDAIETLTQWTQEPGSTFQFKVGVFESYLTVETNLPYESSNAEEAGKGAEDMVFGREGDVSVYGLDAKDKLFLIGGTVTDIPAQLAVLRRRAEKAGLLQKQTPQNVNARNKVTGAAVKPAAPSAPRQDRKI